MNSPLCRNILLACTVGFSALACGPLATAALKKDGVTYKTETDIPYHEGAGISPGDDYKNTQCRLDVYAPDNVKGFPTVVWFHGGGLTEGNREFPGLKDQGIALVAVGYRLAPQANFPDYLEDAAAATAWVMKHIAERGGDPDKVFVAGGSAGGYLAAMIGMDGRWLKPHGLSNRKLAGVIPVSAQATTHFLVKKQRGDTGPRYRPIVDEYAPLYHASKDLPPICLITGDRRVEFKSLVEENDLLAASLRNLGHPWVEFYEMGGLNHSRINGGAWLLMPGFIEKVSDDVTARATMSP